ncbi:putative male-specific lethal-3 protein-like 2 isoform X1 [Phymastichus coffea]|uniref:putative male-specific lethal-3 protein-like 2 isoform X1 n=1 Tax=Phymastichus coffea TaxID=108790 RepID=UPI00273BDE5E|nr:putative male-specific lethal-3 protein-like 2 isoform X1 [Phymastichus coffea]
MDENIKSPSEAQFKIPVGSPSKTEIDISSLKIEPQNSPKSHKTKIKVFPSEIEVQNLPKSSATSVPNSPSDIPRPIVEVSVGAIMNNVKKKKKRVPKYCNTKLYFTNRRRRLQQRKERQKQILLIEGKIATEKKIATKEKIPEKEEISRKEEASKEISTDIVTEDSESSSEFEEGSSGDEDSGSDAGGPRHEVDIEIGNTLKRVLEQDHVLINSKNKLAVLPAQPTVISILESWVLHYTTTQLNNMPDKRQRNSKAPNILEKTITDINLCRETADGIRVYFDHTLGLLLLYPAERSQYSTIREKALFLLESSEESITVKDEIIESDITIKDEMDDSEFAHLPPFKEQEAEAEKSALNSTRRKLRSSRVNSIEEPKPSKPIEEVKQETGNVSSLNSLASTSSRCSSPRGVTLRMSAPPINSAQVNELLEKASKWRLVKEGAAKAAMPSNIYGAIHLVRLFVRLPDLLQRSDITDGKLKVVLKYIDMFLSFIEMHKEWFGEQFYMSKASFEESNTNTVQ